MGIEHAEFCTQTRPLLGNGHLIGQKTAWQGVAPVFEFQLPKVKVGGIGHSANWTKGRSEASS
ncbi:TPA: hypothetical protein DCE37_23190 [Candidatus Latescibacteria bacterium]|nr:hypothetical protein [Candidatus Latescibacterota bacterium]